ncbi:hypothetical protein CR513_52217, partial [Mucuna pruriens]
MVKNVSDLSVIEKILHSMTLRYDYVVCSIEESQNLDSMIVDELQSSLLVHEQRMNGHNSHEEQALKVAQDETSTGRGRGRNVFQGGVTRGRGRGRGRGGKQPIDKATIQWDYCHKFGHFLSECPKKRQDSRANYVEGGQEAVLLMAQHSTDDKSNAQKMWFIDSSCSNHMTGEALDGIQRQLTTSYTPQQNGIAKRKNHTIISMVRSVLIERGIPRSFQLEAINWKFNPCNKTIKPEEAWSEMKPFVSYYRIFGCIGFVHVPDQKRSKLDDKSTKCVLLGVCEESKAYKLYDPINEKIHISGDDWGEAKISRTLDANELNPMEESYQAVEEVIQTSLNDTAATTSTIVPNSTSNLSNLSLRGAEVLTEGRATKPLAWMKDYVTGDDLTYEDAINFAMFASANPVTYNQASQIQHWRDTMDAEIQAIQRNDTWELSAFLHGEINEDVCLEQPPGIKLLKTDQGVEVDSILFKQLVGSLMYLTATRPDIAHSVSLISRFMKHPKDKHFLVAKHILRYLQETQNLEIFYKTGGNKELLAYTYSDYAGDLDNRKSTSRYAFMLGRDVIFWVSKKQPVSYITTKRTRYIILFLLLVYNEEILNPFMPMALRLSGILMGAISFFDPLLSSIPFFISFNRGPYPFYGIMLDFNIFLSSVLFSTCLFIRLRKVEINEAWKVKTVPDLTLLPKEKSKAKKEAVTLPGTSEINVADTE